MHRILREALPEATGESEFVIVVVADIRGFSSFSHQHESPDIAMYIKRVYMELIDHYFPEASFYKPTGDGLLVTIPYNEKNLKEVANKTVEGCLSCVEKFGSICADDAMINFPTPDLVGFGLARGTACRLSSGDKILDYSGHLLNLATRLMGLARPSGVVLEGAFGIQLLKPETQTLFEQANVYLRGLAEETPVRVYHLKGRVEIPEESKSPITKLEWTKLTMVLKLHEWEKLGHRFQHDLPGTLKRPNLAVAMASYPTYQKGKRLKVSRTWHTFEKVEYRTTGDKPYLLIYIAEWTSTMKSDLYPRTTPVTIEISYVLEKGK